MRWRNEGCKDVCDPIAVLVMTDGRGECISQAIPSLLANLKGNLGLMMIHDDSADQDYQDWLRTEFPDWLITSGSRRLGFGGAYERAWKIVDTVASDDHRYIFSTEDDFTFNRPVDLVGMSDVLDTMPHLKQMALRRQPWNDEEIAAGGIIERFPRADFEEFRSQEHSWLEHRRWFTTNPSLIPRSVIEQGWPNVPQSEGMFTHQLLTDPMARFGYWGTYDSGEWVTHIGNQRVGTGY